MKRVWIGLLAAVVVAGIGYWTVARRSRGEATGVREDLSVTLVFERQIQGKPVWYGGGGPLVWVLPEVLVVVLAEKLQAWDVSTRTLKWELAVKTKIDAVAAGDGVLYMAEDDIHMAGLPPRLRVIDGNTGQEILEGINSATPNLVQCMVWVPAVRRLAVVAYEGLLVYDEKLALAQHVPCKIIGPIASVCGGELLLSTERGLSLGVDLQSGSRYPLSGDISKEEQLNLAVVDGQNISSTYHHPDGSFIQVISGGWGNDRIRFYQGITPKSPIPPDQADPEAVVSPVAAGAGLRVEVASANGHYADVCWPGKWLAVSGNGDGLAFFSTETGKQLTIQGQAAASQAYDLRVSPDGEKVAALAEKGHLYVWKVKVHR